jgi:poly-gamma-glutamate synthesis protein (capsule biosynthesis protein)
VLVKIRIFLIAISLTAFTATTFSQASTQKTITLSFGGDVNGEFPISKTVAKGLEPLGDAADIFRASDIAAVNLETAVTTIGVEAEKQYVFSADYSLLPALKKNGVSVVNVANNHSFDFGVDGFVESLKNIKKSGITAIGGGMDYKSAWAPTIISKNGIKVAFIGVGRVNGGKESIATYKSPGLTSNWDEKGVLAAIAAAKKITPVIVVMVHWGIEKTHCARPAEKKSADLWVKAGATAIIGSHPHFQQAIVAKNGSVIAYSLGNLAFYSSQGDSGRTGVLTLAINAQGKVVTSTYTPLKINSLTGQPEHLSVTDAAKYKADVESYKKTPCIDAEGL